MQPDLFIDEQDRLVIRDEPKLKTTLAALPQRPWIAAYWVKEATGKSYASIGRLRELGVLTYRVDVGPKGSPRYTYLRDSVVAWIKASYVPGRY